MQRLRPVEILLIEFILYSVLWLTNEYLATLLSLIFGSIFLFVFLISLIVELIERSKVPRWYFTFMIASILAPVIAALFFVGLNGGLDWMQD